ncbi:MAG TPA: GNAT family N-acetyltransferase [Phnomibacter sp.]|nr:GNAT family N-acetyltransferase [Phnomibacter sp.]
MPYPILETGRLWLQSLLPHMQGEHITWQPATGEALANKQELHFASKEEAHHFEVGFQQYQKFDLGHWAIIRKQDGLLLGWCGLRLNEEDNSADLGFRLAPAYWRHGYTAEAADACVKFAFTYTGIDCIYARLKTGNAGAAKVLSALGMTKQNDTIAAGSAPGATQAYSIKKEDWLSLQ